MRRGPRRPPARLLVAVLVLSPTLVLVPAPASSAESEACAGSTELAGAKLGNFALGNEAPPYFYYATEGTQGTFTVHYDAPVCDPQGAHVEVDYDTPPLSTDPNPPTTPGDYTRKTGTLTWDIPEHGLATPKSVQVTTADDGTAEAAAEPIDVKLTDVRGGPEGSPLRAPMFIVDDEGSTRARFAVPSHSAPESDTSVTLPVLRAGPASGTVGYQITSASPGADPATDLTTPTTGPVSFSSDGRLGKIEVGVVNDTTPESDDTFNVTLTGSGVTIVEPSTMSFTITDEDTVTYTLSVTKTGTGGGTVTSSPAGINCGTDCFEPYLKDTVVTLTATPDPGSVFAGWVGGGCSGTSTCDVLMDGNKGVTAKFETGTYTLTVQREGSGTVTSSPAGINCGTDCSEPYAPDTTVRLTAQAASGWEFVEWTGGGCTGSASTCDVVMNANKTVTATFQEQDATTYTLTVGKDGTGAGTVTSNPAGINCGSDCSEPYDPGTTVTLTATPGTDSVFDGWTNCPAPSGNQCTVTMNSTRSVTARFEALYDLVVVPPDPGRGTVTSSPGGISCGTDCAEKYKAGTQVTLTAAAATGYTFTGWSGACSGMTCQVTMSGDRTVSAAFEDVTAPQTSFHHPKHNKTYKRTDYLARTIHVFTPANDPSGIDYAQTALRRKKTNGNCGWWNGSGWSPDGCGQAALHRRWLQTWLFGPWNDKLIYEYPKSPKALDPLKPSIGTKIKNYFVYARAEDGAGNLETTFELGRNKNRFEVKKG